MRSRNGEGKNYDRRSITYEALSAASLGAKLGTKPNDNGKNQYISDAYLEKLAEREGFSLRRKKCPKIKGFVAAF